MPTYSPTPKILIVGAGPVGLILALTLLRNGVKVRVIDKSTTPRIGQRGSGIQPRTMELFEALGFVDKVMEGSISVPQMKVYKLPGGTEVLNEFSGAPHIPETPDRPYTNGRLLGQEVLDKITVSELKDKYGYSVDLGVELTHLEQVGDNVNVKLQRQDGEIEDASYDYVVGADGAKGSVRKLLGLSFLGETRATQKFLIGDFFLKGLSQDRWHMWGEMSNVLLTIRPTETEGLFNFIIGSVNLPQIEDSVDAFRAFIKEHTGGREDIVIGKIVCIGQYTVNIRMVNKFSNGRAFVAGDAAHIHSPAGGQGLNTGVQDAYNLGWKLALVIKGHAPASLLDTYSAERLPVVADMLEITTATHTESSAVKRADIQGVQNAFQRTGKIHQFGVNYRTSPIVVDDGTDKEAARAISAYGDDIGGPVHPGDRAPDAPDLVQVRRGLRDLFGTVETRLFLLFSPTRHTVLVFADKFAGGFTQTKNPILWMYPAELVRFVVVTATSQIPYGLPHTVDLFTDRGGHAYDAYKDPEGVGKVFVIRPDGHVGARLASLDRVEDYFKGIFGDHFKS